RPARGRPHRRQRDDLRDRQDRRPPRDPPQRRRPLRRRARRRSGRRVGPTAVTPPTTTKQRIVVADDSRLMRRILSDALGRQGFDVVATAADGDQALEACRAHRPDALTLDLAMPGMDGIGVLRALRQGKAEALPVVVVSAFSPAHGARAVDALAEGAFARVAKPALGGSMDTFTAELGRKVGAATESGRARKRLASSTLRRPVRPHVSTPVPPRPAIAPARPRAAGKKMVLIASSTGGPKALGDLVPTLPAPLGS